jgi:hypothetical protein
MYPNSGPTLLFYRVAARTQPLVAFFPMQNVSRPSVRAHVRCRGREEDSLKRWWQSITATITHYALSPTHRFIIVNDDQWWMALSQRHDGRVTIDKFEHVMVDPEDATQLYRARCWTHVQGFEQELKQRSREERGTRRMSRPWSRTGLRCSHGRRAEGCKHARACGDLFQISFHFGFRFAGVTLSSSLYSIPSRHAAMLMACFLSCDFAFGQQATCRVEDFQWISL